MTYLGEPRFNPFPSTYVPVPAVTTVLVFLCFSATQYLLLHTDPRIKAGFRLLYTRSFSISVSSIHVYSYSQLKLNNVLRLSTLYPSQILLSSSSSSSQSSPNGYDSLPFTKSNHRKGFRLVSQHSKDTAVHATRKDTKQTHVPVKKKTEIEKI
jgi:hypothetical protein